MKKRILVIVFVLLVTNAFAGGPYFCVREGCQLYYERYEAGTGKFMQTTLLDFVSVRQTEDGRFVKYGMTLSKPNGRSMFGGRAEMTVEVADNGDVRMDVGGSVKRILHNMFPHATITSEGSSTLMPAGMMPGDTLPDTHARIIVAGLNYTMDITERTVLREEKLTTPAGEFDCVVAREHKVERGPFHFSDIWCDTWYASGFGYVRHDSYDKRMRILSSEILVRIDF